MHAPATGARFGRRGALGAALGLAAAGRAAAARAAAASPGGATFPLRVAAGQRYLEDAAGRPFLIHGNSAWSLIAQLRMEEAEEYLLDRRARGFNTLLVSLLEHRFARNAPANIYGDPPFTVPGDFDTPNEHYFEHADRVLTRAAELGFLVLLTPAYVGYGGGEDGWYQSMVANGAAKLQRYGAYLGQRYADRDNILWVHGGDYNPRDKSVVRAIVDGIRLYDVHSLHTAHCAPERAALGYWAEEPWLQVNTAYTYGPVYVAALAEHARRERMPFFLIESAYENEQNATEVRLRTQAYHALLCGACGQVFGNSPIWHFEASPDHQVPITWRQALNGAGTQSMQHLLRLFGTLPWWLLEPDTDKALLSRTLHIGQDRAVAATASDGSFALCYLPSQRTVTLNLARLRGPRLRASWYDPTMGRFADIDQADLGATENAVLRTPGPNGSGSTDWVLLLAAHD